MVAHSERLHVGGIELHKFPGAGLAETTVVDHLRYQFPPYKVDAPLLRIVRWLRAGIWVDHGERENNIAVIKHGSN